MNVVEFIRGLIGNAFDFRVSAVDMVLKIPQKHKNKCPLKLKNKFFKEKVEDNHFISNHSNGKL